MIITIQLPSDHKLIRKPAFRLFFCFLLVVAIFLPLPALATPTYGNLDNQEQKRREIAEVMEAATIFVIGFCNDDDFFFGSGFLVSDQLVLTNAHVVEGANPEDIYVVNDKMPLTKATIKAIAHEEEEESFTIPTKDFALLSLETRPSEIPVLSFSLDAHRMDRVSAWGYPGMIGQFDKSLNDLIEGDADPDDFHTPPLVYTEGTISAFVKNEGESIVHTASIAGGNSGGPLINRDGEVVGINTWGYTEEKEGAFINASLPAHVIIEFLKENGIEPKISGALVTSNDLPAAKNNTKALDKNQSQGDLAPADTTTSPKPSDNSEKKPTNTQNPELSPENQLLLQKAEKGDTEAKKEVGSLYMEGEEGFPEDIEQARYWLELASTDGNLEARGLLGLIYLGIYDPEIHDPKKAVRLLLEYCDSSEAKPDFQAFLSAIYYNGEYLGVPFNPDDSLKWAEKAAQKKDATALALIGRHYHEGHVVDENQATALEFAQKALEVNPDDSMALGLMASLSYYGNNNSTEINLLEVATKAAEDGDTMSMGILAMLYAFEEEYHDDILAERWARRAAGQAGYLGFYVLGRFYLEGRVVDKNPVLAWTYLSLASERFDDSTINGGPYLEIAESQLNQTDMKRALKIRSDLLTDWGLLYY